MRDSPGGKLPVPHEEGSAVVSLSDYGQSRSRGAGAATGSAVIKSSEALRVLAVLDGTRESSRLLNYLLELRQGVKTMEVVVIHCYRPSPWQPLGALGGGHRKLLGDLTKKSRQFASRKLAAAQIKHSHRLKLGDPTELVLECLRQQPAAIVLLAGHDRAPRWSRLLSKVGLAVDTLPTRIMRRTAVPVCVVN